MRRQVTTIIAAAGLSLVPASVAGAQPLRVTDPRSPDARDAQTLVVVPSGVIANAAPTVSSPSSSDDGIGWTEAGGGLALLALLGLGAGYAVQHRRHRPTAPLAH